MLDVPHLDLPLLNLLPLLIILHLHIGLGLPEMLVHLPQLYPLDILILLIQEVLFSLILLVLSPPAVELVVDGLEFLFLDGVDLEPFFLAVF